LWCGRDGLSRRAVDECICDRPGGSLATIGGDRQSDCHDQGDAVEKRASTKKGAPS